MASWISAFPQALLNQITSPDVVQFRKSRSKLDVTLRRLQSMLQGLMPVLMDAEGRQTKDEALKHWLRDLADVFYDVEDFLDEIVFDAQQRILDAESRGSSIRNPRFIPGFLKSKHKTVSSKIMTSIIERLNEVSIMKEQFTLTEGQRPKVTEVNPGITTSLVDEHIVYGRDHDVARITELLLSDDASYDVSVVSIVGMGGLGKTTLAQLVYNQIAICSHFDFRMWVSVSDDFDVVRLTRATLESVTFPSSTEIRPLELLQQQLRRALMGKRFLLVLDDVWNEDFEKWSLMKTPLMAGAKGSKIVVTTRSQRVAAIMSKLPSYALDLLSEDECWSIFSKHAFGFDYQRSDPALEAIGKNILRKCRGLPLAAKTLGSLLRTKQTVREWEAVLKSDLWAMEDNMRVLPMLRLSFEHLPAYVKRCFAYCSLFPREYEFEKEKLVLLWMAEGFLPESGSQLMEELGEQFFNDLLSRSFFQQSSSKQSRYVMHDLLVDLAKSVSEDNCFVWENDFGFRASEETFRHASYIATKLDTANDIKLFSQAKRLRSLLAFNPGSAHETHHLTSDRDFRDLLAGLPQLRVLSLPFYNIPELPDMIGNLKHIRYLDFSHNTLLEMLPESICCLFYLQTLILSGCRSFIKLPGELAKLINLRYLDIRGTDIQEMPLQMSRLGGLHTLTNFIVSEGGSRIRELSGLFNLHGALSISKLQNVEDEKDATDANLKEKRYLSWLKLDWGSNSGISPNGMSVMQNLQPPDELKELIIASYPGVKLPNWLGYSSLSNLVSLQLIDCLNCSDLPPLGQLPRLEILLIEGFHALHRVSKEFFGNRSSSAKPFQFLKTLKFARMIKWEKWVTLDAQGDEFHCLNELIIENCPKLKMITGRFLSLEKLVVLNWNQPTVSFPLPVTSDLCDVRIDGEKVTPRSKDDIEMPVSMDDDAASVSSIESYGTLVSSSNSYRGDYRSTEQKAQSTYSFTYQSPSPMYEWEMRAQRHGVLRQETFRSLNASDTKMIGANVTADLQSLRIEGCQSESLADEIKTANHALQHLYIIDCCFLKSLSPVSHSLALKTLHIRNCRKLEFQFTQEMASHYALLEIVCLESSCDDLKVFPLNFFPKLRILCLRSCSSLESISIEEERELKNLDALEIRDCPNLEYFPREGLLAPNLTSIFFSSCLKLQTLPRHMKNLKSLQSLNISKCPRLESLPLDGLPSSLNVLCVASCDKILPKTGWQLKRLDSLIQFEIEGGCETMDSFPEEGLLPANLVSLRISMLPNLRLLHQKALTQLTSLETLEINCCRRLGSLPERLPSSLTFLSVKECPLLKAKLQNKNGTEWSKIAHIPDIFIDEQKSQ